MENAVIAPAVFEPVASADALPVCLWKENPNRLVSLWDMLKRYAFSFYQVITRIEQLRTGARALVHAHSYTNPKQVYDHDLEMLIATLVEMEVECGKLDLPFTTDLISHIESDVHQKGGHYNYIDLLNHLDTLSAMFAKELGKNECFCIPAEKNRYLEKDDLFGTKVNDAFPSCATDVHNAGNCYALGQDEATAFHCMRILERGLNALANKFGVDFSHTNWHNVIEEIEKKIRKMDSNFGADWKEQQKVCSQAATHFMFLKDSWRNYFVHGRDIPYDPGRAFSVFDHVRQFMQALAAGGLKE